MSTPRPIRSRPRVIHVVQDEPGGGPAHAELLHDAMAHLVDASIVRITPASDPRSWREAVRQISEARGLAGKRPLLHVHGVRPTTAAAPVAKIARLPLVTTVHGLHSIRRGDRGPVRMQNKLALSSPDLVLAYSDDDLETLREMKLVSPKRLRKIRMAFPERPSMRKEQARAELDIPQDAAVILWLGLVQEGDPKNVEIFAAALERMAERAFVLVAGDGPWLEAFKRELSGPDFRGRTRFTGWLADPGPAIAAGDVSVNVSTWEGISFSTVEAARAGNALVLSDVPGNRNLIRMGAVARSVPLRDAGALATALDQLVGDPRALSAAGVQARLAVEDAFPIEGLVADVMNAYRDAATGRRR